MDFSIVELLSMIVPFLFLTTFSFLIFKAITKRKSRALVQLPETLNGVRGWLLLLCINLTLLSPLFLLVQAFAMTKQAEDPTVVTVTVILAVLLAVYSAVIGIRLWLVKARAVRHTRVFLIVTLGWNLLDSILAIVTHAEYTGAIQLATSILSFMIWWSYLKNSVRVQNTYAIADEALVSTQPQPEGTSESSPNGSSRQR